jgi:hypothetical protein
MNNGSVMRAVIGIVVITIAAPGHVRAQPADAVTDAERLFNEARELAKASRWAEACPKFEASLRADPALGTRLNLATCYENIGQLARAWDLYRESVGIAEHAGDPERRHFARTHAEALEPRLARLAIHAPADPPAGFGVTRDGSALDAGALDIAVYVDPGRHEIVASAPGFVAFSKVVTLSAGKTETLAIPRLNSAAASSDGAKPPISAAVLSGDPAASRSQTRAYAAISLGAAGFAAVGVGLLFGVNARSELHEAKLLCGDRLVCEGNATYQLGQQLIHDARSHATASTVLVAAGGGAIIAGAVLYFTRPSMREPTSTAVVPVAHERGAGLVIIRSF